MNACVKLRLKHVMYVRALCVSIEMVEMPKMGELNWLIKRKGDF